VVVHRNEPRARVEDLEVRQVVLHGALHEVPREDQQKGRRGSPSAEDAHGGAPEGQGAWADSCVAGGRCTFLGGQIAEVGNLLAAEGHCNKLNETLAGRAGPGVQSGRSSFLAGSWTEDGRQLFEGAEGHHSTRIRQRNGKAYGKVYG